MRRDRDCAFSWAFLPRVVLLLNPMRLHLLDCLLGRLSATKHYQKMLPVVIAVQRAVERMAWE
jgi:hypothetical protein